MTVAIITLAVTVLAATGALAWSVHQGAKWQREAQNAADLYHRQLEIKFDIEKDRDDYVLKVSACEAQIRELRSRLAATERQRNQAIEEARKQVAKEIRSAPNAVDALNRVLQAGAGKTEAAKPEPAAGDSGADGLLITELR